MVNIMNGVESERNGIGNGKSLMMDLKYNKID